MSYVNLHSHSHYSLLDGFGSPKAIIERAKELGYPAAALTDHGVTYGLVEFYKAAKEAGIKPLLGCELYVARRTRFDKEAKVDVKPYHLTMIAKNNVGYKNLLYLVSQAHLEGFYYKPRVDYDLLKKHSEGLIALSGCQAGHLSRAILSENDEEIKKVIDTHLDIFGEGNYFLEVQDHPLIETQAIVNKKIFELGKEYNLDVVATNDTHYPRPEDSEVHDIMLCIQTGSIVSDIDRMKYTGDFSICAVDDVSAAFPDNPEVIENTLKIADMCDVELSFGVNLIPHFDTPNKESSDEYLRVLCEKGLLDRFKGEKFPDEYQERLDYELKMVHEMGFDTYFLIVWDFVKFAKDSNIVVGPGRGSAAGSIIAWTLGITELDPIHYGLFFERFLNPERVSMPDIDIDFADNRRDEVLAYVVDKYGRDKVAQIVTFGTMAPRAAVRDVGRALGYPYAEVDALAKIIPQPILGQQIPLRKSVKDDPELSNEYSKNPRAKVLLDYAKKIEGTVRHVGTHACAVVISEQPLTNYTALQYGASG
ncbi:DNA polymerase III subunit alpha, partial [Candidatus Peregrinibacteria bacterium]|nr:DNA polymerase III subunit alpha [Candidatus Peregrinibacteria bacterium]